MGGSVWADHAEPLRVSASPGIMDICKSLFFYAVVSLVCSIRCVATDVLTYHNDNSRTGWNPNEVILTPANVNPNAFGLLFNLIVDGKVDAQPLYASNAPVFSEGIS